jgi:hypothetical protein
MEQSEIEDARRRIQQEAGESFPEGAISEVALLQYGDDPSVEPGELVVRVVPADDQLAGEDTHRDPLVAFKDAHDAALKRLRDFIRREQPEVRYIEIIADADSQHRAQLRMITAEPRPPERGGDFTPVMARLGTTDLETLDTLITTGIASNRADAVRWALARIRERPAYAELRERARQIEELKTQF